jgi:hypothetical protein
MSIPRRTVLFGTTNDAQYLTDHTGARRFWPIYFARAIDIGWLRENRDALFAEAMHFFEQGEAFHDSLDELQSEERQKALTRRLVTPAWQQKLLQHINALPIPHLTGDEGMRFPGVITTQYVANLQKQLDLPQSVAHMTSSQLAAFIKRAGFVQLALAYRPHEGLPTKLFAWGHPSLKRLNREQQHAFLSNFPDLFVGKTPPKSWLAQQVEHLEPALEILRTSPVNTPLDFNTEGD